MSELKDFSYLSLDQLHQTQCPLLTLGCILQNGQSTITRKQIENNHQMTLHDFI